MKGDEANRRPEDRSTPVGLRNGVDDDLGGPNVGPDERDGPRDKQRSSHNPSPTPTNA